MQKIFDDAKDKNVGAFVVYGKAADNKIYYEAAFTTQAKQADVEDAFKKGRLLVAVPDGSDGFNYLAPFALEANVVTTASVVSSTLTAAKWTALATPAG